MRRNSTFVRDSRELLFGVKQYQKQTELALERSIEHMGAYASWVDGTGTDRYIGNDIGDV